MGALLSRALGGVLFGTCLFSGIFLMLTLAVTLRLLPRMLSGLRTMIWAALIGSYRFYAMLFNLATSGRYAIAPQTNAAIFGRMVICTVLSLGIGAGILLALQLAVSGWWLALLAVHGAFVGLFWDEIPNAGPFRLGDRIE